MKLLALDSSGLVASVAILDGETLVAEYTLNYKKTHSQTLLPMLDEIVKMTQTELSEVDAIAVAAGPGSFTGVRIGVATVKGLAFNDDIPCFSVSTLEAIAYNFVDKNAVVCAVMDARRMQFYNALFKVQNGKVERLCDDRAISIEDLRNDLKQYDKVVIAGDGAKLCFQNIELENCTIADDDRIYQNAVGVAKAAQNKNAISPKALMPVYLRQSQAERELKLKLKR